MKQPLTQDIFINKWLLDYHNTTLDEIISLHREDWHIGTDKYNPSLFYDKYKVTKQQHDDWYKWAINLVRRHYNYGRKFAERAFSTMYLNTAPMYDTTD